jgi:hypothetical protein
VNRTIGTPSRSRLRATISSTPGGVPAARARAAGPLVDRPVGDGVGERHAHLDQVGAALAERLEQQIRGGEVRVARHQERDEGGAAFLPAAFEGSSMALIAPSGPACGEVIPPPLAGRRRWVAVGGSSARLGRGRRPTPHRFDVLVAPPGEVDQDDPLLAQVRRVLAASAMAWALSRAGRIPSVSASRWKASIASASDARCTRRARSWSSACSGPTAG